MKMVAFSVLLMLSSVSAFAETPVCHVFEKVRGANVLNVEGRSGWGVAAVDVVALNEAVADLLSKLPTSGIKLCVKGTQTAGQYFVYEAYVATPGLRPTF